MCLKVNTRQKFHIPYAPLLCLYSFWDWSLFRVDWDGVCGMLWRYEQYLFNPFHDFCFIYYINVQGDDDAVACLWMVSRSSSTCFGGLGFHWGKLFFLPWIFMLSQNITRAPIQLFMLYFLLFIGMKMETVLELVWLQDLNYRIGSA